MMNNVSHKKTWNLGMAHVHMEPPSNPLIKSKHDNKSDKDFVKLKFQRDLTSDMLELYEFKMTFFDNGYSEEFLLFIQNFNMTLTASGTLTMGAKVQYPRTIVCGEVQRHFELLSSDLEGTDPLTVETIILGLASYFYPVNSLSNQKRVMRRGMRNP